MSTELLQENFDALSMTEFPSDDWTEGRLFIDKTCDTQLQFFAFTTASGAHAIRFRARACPHLLAACELVCKALSELEKPAQWPQIHALISELDIPIEKSGRVLLLEDAVADLSERLLART